MYRLWVKWIIVGFAAVPPHAFAEGAEAAMSFESGVGTSEAIGQNGIFLGPQAVGVLSVTATSLLLSATSIYLYQTHETKRVYREAREEARQALARDERSPITAGGPETSLARAVEIEKDALRRENRAIPQLTEREWAIVVYNHAAEVEAL